MLPTSNRKRIEIQVAAVVSEKEYLRPKQC